MTIRTVRRRFREVAQDFSTGENPVLLTTFSHPDLQDGPIRLSSDPTVRLSTEPLVYGTRSRLTGSEAPLGALAVAAEFKAVLMDFVLPQDQETALTSNQVVFENVSSDIVDVVRSFRTPARVDFAIVLASSPNYVDFEWTDLRTMSASWDDTSVTLTVSRQDYFGHSWPIHHMTKSRFPGLH